MPYVCALSELAATAMASARFPHYHVLKYRMCIATSLVTVVVVNIATDSEAAIL